MAMTVVTRHIANSNLLISILGSVCVFFFVEDKFRYNLRMSHVVYFTIKFTINTLSLFSNKIICFTSEEKTVVNEQYF